MNKKAELNIVGLLLIGLVIGGGYIYIYKPAYICNQIPLICNNLNNNQNYTINQSNKTNEVIYIHLISSPSSNFNYDKLLTFSNDWKKYLNESTYGTLNNVEFIMDAQPSSYPNPGVNDSEFGTKIKATYFIASAEEPIPSFNYYINYNSNINWTFSFASFKFQYPIGYTQIYSDGTYSNCDVIKRIDSSTTSTIPMCRTSSHELFHALFMCEDYEGNIMRPIEGLTDMDHVPPICLQKIKYYLPQILR